LTPSVPCQGVDDVHSSNYSRNQSQRTRHARGLSSFPRLGGDRPVIVMTKDRGTAFPPRPRGPAHSPWWAVIVSFEPAASRVCSFFSALRTMHSSVASRNPWPRLPAHPVPRDTPHKVTQIRVSCRSG